MKKSNKQVRPSRVSKNKKPVSKNVLYLISAAIVLFILSAGLQEPQNLELQAQTASESAGLSPAASPAFGCLGNCPMQITPAVSPVTISPGAGAVIPVVSQTVAPAVSGNPQNPAGVPAGANGDPLAALENPNGKVPPGRLKKFLNSIINFFMVLFGLGGNQAGNPNVPGAQINPGAQQQQPDGQQAGGNEKEEPDGGNEQGDKPGYGNNPGTENPGGHVVEPQSQKKIEQEEQQQAQQGASVPGTLNQQGGAGAAAPQINQENILTNLLNLLKQLFGGQTAKQ